MLSVVKITLTIIVICFINSAHCWPQAECMPWTYNTREHLFGYISNNPYNAHVSIQDEGFRWRNSFNFTINNNAIYNWNFNKIIDYVGENFIQDALGYRNRILYQNTNVRAISGSNSIHQHLSKIAWNVKTINGPNCASASVAAVTVIVHDGTNYHAFSRTIGNENMPYVASTIGNAQNTTLSYLIDDARAIRRNLMSLTNFNIPHIGYRCTEGRILSKLIANNFLIFKNTIAELLQHAQQSNQDANFTYNSIHAIILHIGTTMDPCAICTRNFTGLSKHINENPDVLRDAASGTAGNINARFLIEVSSNGHYGGAHINAPGSFSEYCGQCSHAECAGHDGGEENLINIQALGAQLFPGPDNSILVVPGGIKPWRFNQTFPPYVVFGRVDNVNLNLNHQVVNAPVMCQNAGGINHAQHQNMFNLPLVQ